MTARLAECFEVDAERTNGLRRLDKGSADIMVADDTKLEGDAARLRKTYRSRCTAIGNGHDNISLKRCFLGEVDTHILAGGINIAATNNSVRTGKIYIFEQAKPLRFRVLRLERLNADGTISLNLANHDFAIFDITNEIWHRIMSSAQLSEAKIGLPLRSPITSGRMPIGSRAAINFVRVRASIA